MEVKQESKNELSPKGRFKTKESIMENENNEQQTDAQENTDTVFDKKSTDLSESEMDAFENRPVPADLTDEQLEKVKNKLESGEISMIELGNMTVDDIEKTDEGGDDPDESDTNAPEDSEIEEEKTDEDDSWQEDYISERYPNLHKSSGAKTFDQLLAAQENGFKGNQEALETVASFKKLAAENGFESVQQMAEALKVAREQEGQKPTDDEKMQFEGLHKHYDELIAQAKEADDKFYRENIDPDDREGYIPLEEQYKAQKDYTLKIADAVANEYKDLLKVRDQAINSLAVDVHIMNLERRFENEPDSTKELWGDQKEEIFKFLLENPKILYGEDPLKAAYSALAAKNPDMLKKLLNENQKKVANKHKKLSTAEMNARLKKQMGSGKISRKSHVGGESTGDLNRPKWPGEHATKEEKRQYYKDIKAFREKQDALFKPLDGINPATMR